MAFVRRLLAVGPASRRWGNEALVFATLRGVTLTAGVAALLIVPLRPEHQLHLAPLLVAFLLYNAALLAILTHWADEAWAIFAATLAADLVLVFLLVWFTGGGTSHFYVLFYPLVALNAYYFGPAIGTVAAVLAAGLLALANRLALPSESWSQIGARAMILALLGLALGHVAARERAERARVERLNREMETTMARLARAERLAAVGRLSAKVAHEVRNPLGAIALNIDMLGDVVAELSGPSAAEAREHLARIRIEIGTLADLTEEYLVAARLPRPKLEQESLNDLVSELAAFLRPLAQRQDVEIGLDLDAGLPAVACDRAMLRLAVRNLIKNSLEVLPTGGRITVRTRGDAGEAMITVADDGPGIEAEAAQRLSEPFFTTKPGGTGLGLSIAGEIVREHGGRMTWRTELGAGAEFTLRLPLGESRDA